MLESSAELTDAHFTILLEVICIYLSINVFPLILKLVLYDGVDRFGTIIRDKLVGLISNFFGINAIAILRN